MQPLFDALTRLVERAGTGDVSLLSGTGGAEMAVVADMWSASRGEIGVGEVVLAHGFHGPSEGEVSSRVWREDDAPLRAMIEQYSARDEAEIPVDAPAEAAALEAMQATCSARFPGGRARALGWCCTWPRSASCCVVSPSARSCGASTSRRGPPRRIGEQLVAEGKLGRSRRRLQPHGLGAHGIVAAGRQGADSRAARHACHLRAEPLCATGWLGLPERVRRRLSRADDSEVSGIGVSPGTVEGKVRVVTDPGFTEVEPDEVLVAPITDPSWSSIMFISSALVVDVGGALTHAAVVARELEVPCVVDTGDGTTGVFAPATAFASMATRGRWRSWSAPPVTTMGARMAETSRKPAKRGPKAQARGGKKRPRRTQHERTAESTQRLTDAAIALIAEKGFNNTTLAEIGERAGYSRSMVQFRFGTKEGFLESLLREEYETRLLVRRNLAGQQRPRARARTDRSPRTTKSKPRRG